MKKKPDVKEDDRRPEYDPALIRSGVRSKHTQRYRAGTNLVPLDADVLRAFPNAKAVNDVLRLLIRTAKQSVKRS
jgi:hypothetical protein